ncbi:MAG: RHS repeat-associated core domain-containing protein, partial [Kiritimatiellae bacterium]|nr:RHS repeat-associated core domain-containing protein [Kiritimatiellia bacterium]
ATYSYDRKSQLTSAEVSKKGKGRFGKERLYDVHYTYDAAGNRIAMELVPKLQSGLDGGQLPVQSYAPTHDRHPQLKHPLKVEYSYNDADQLVTETAYRLERRRSVRRAWETEYAYDANGNVMTKTLNRRPGWDDDLAPGQHETKYEYDYQNLLSKISYPDGEINTFQNCRCGTFRLQKVDSTGLRNYLYDKENDSPIFETDENYNPVVKYIKGPRIDELISKKYFENGQWMTMYYLYDGLGSVRQLTDERGRVVAEYDYLPFGEIIEAQGVQARKNPFTYTGREYDRDSGLYYYRARYMDPRLGRFTSKDPLENMLIQSWAGHTYSRLGRFTSKDPLEDILIQKPEDIPVYVNSGSSGCINCSPTFGRWFSRDHSVSATLRENGADKEAALIVAYMQSYAYVDNSPLTYVDPFGLKADSCCKQGYLDCFAKCVEKERFDLEAALGTAAATLGLGTMPKTSAELRGFGIPKKELEPWTGQPSRWAGRTGLRGLRIFGRSKIGITLGRLSTGALIFEGFYDIGAIGRCSVVCANDSCAY